MRRKSVGGERGSKPSMVWGFWEFGRGGGLENLGDDWSGDEGVLLASLLFGVVENAKEMDGVVMRMLAIIDIDMAVDIVTCFILTKPLLEGSQKRQSMWSTGDCCCDCEK
mmetsp:Transcript_4859/g.10730  ORF Transcript_4859/g.10730 Transcript_4859/m.10730 type:complete len:110 (+) Transcript_4859:781-1110(+)